MGSSNSTLGKASVLCRSKSCNTIIVSQAAKNIQACRGAHHHRVGGGATRATRSATTMSTTRLRDLKSTGSIDLLFVCSNLYRMFAALHHFVQNESVACAYQCKIPFFCREHSIMATQLELGTQTLQFIEGHSLVLSLSTDTVSLAHTCSETRPRSSESA